MTDSVDVIIPWWRQTTDVHRLRSLDFVLEMWESFGMNPIMGVNDSEIFNRSQARNLGVSLAKSDLIILADGDVVLDRNQVMKGLEIVSNYETWVIPYDVYFNLTEEDSENFLEGRKKLTECNWDHRILSWAGLSIMKREAYLYVGGHDERFCGWGDEDVAFRLVLDHKYGGHKRVTGGIYHLWHPAPHEQTFGSLEYERNHSLFDREYRAKYGWVDERSTWS